MAVVPGGLGFIGAISIEVDALSPTRRAKRVYDRGFVSRHRAPAPRPLVTTSAASLPFSSARQDATVMGLVGLAPCVSHLMQLLLPPLFPWLNYAFHASYAELGVLLTGFFVVSRA